jgi:hypothetical protein
MQRGALHYVEMDGEPRFDEAEVLQLKNSRIAVFPHLTVSSGDARPDSHSEACQPPDEWLSRYQRISAKAQALDEQWRWLAVESSLNLALSREAYAAILRLLRQ